MRVGWTLMVAATTVMVAMAACAGQTSIECDNGFTCPAGMRCGIDRICIADNCGDGFVDSNEICDDGNITAGDGCSANCQSTEECGNGFVDANLGEVCDDGNDVGGDGCSADCLSNELCGNMFIDTALGEVCDDGNNLDTDGCSANCRSNETCGNDVEDTSVGEVCDDGNTVDGDGCDSDCTITGCGNGLRAGSEVCDNGRQCQNGAACDDAADCAGIGDEGCLPRDGDGCSADCASEEICGNGITDDAIGEVCDDGLHCQNGTACSTSNECTGIGDGECRARSGDGCSLDCFSLEICGDLVTDAALGEICDDGRHCFDGTACTDHSQCVGIGDQLCQARSGDGCNNDCTSDETCGNNITDAAAGEVCDDGKHCENGTACTTHTECQGIGDALCVPRTAGGGGCRDDCKSGLACGNGQQDVNEQCDDGNPVDMDDCTNCRVNVCGDGVQNLFGPSQFEECDDGGQTASCDLDCTLPMCGDGVTNPLAGGEQCDSPTCQSGTPCSADTDCSGDGDGMCSARNTPTCDADCTIAVCGDGTLNILAGEACDNGNANGSGDCTTDCAVNICGDGFVDLQGPSTEACDDNNVLDCGSCNASCTGPATGGTCAAGVGCSQGIDCTSGTCSAAGVCQ